MSLILRQVKGSKLTTPEMDGNFTYLEGLASGGGVITLSLADAITLIDNEGVIQGATYLIQGVDSNLYGGTDILVTGLSPIQFSQFGYGKFYNPKYLSFPVWDNSASYNINDTVIYGGVIWINQTGNLGSNDNYFNLDAEDWTVHYPIGDDIATYYNTVWDEISYDIVDDYIQSRYEAISNNRVTVTYQTSTWFFCGYNPLAVFRWGDPYDGNRGVGGCTVENGYLECLNYVSGSIQAVTVKNYSVMANLFMINDSYIEEVNIDNYSTILALGLENSGFYEVSLTNDSGIGEMGLLNSSFYQVTIANNSSIVGSEMSGSNFYNVNIFNNSQISNFGLENSSIYNLQLFNSTSYYNNGITNSTVGPLIADTSYITNLNLSNSTLGFITMKDSEINNINGTNFSMYNVEFTGFYYYLGDFGGISNTSIVNAIYHYNTIKYQYELSFNGQSGHGAIGSLDLSLFPVPPNFFIEKCLVNLRATKDSIEDPVLTIGMSAYDEEGAVNSTNGIFSSLNNRVWCFDLSNGECTGEINNAGNYQQLIANVATAIIWSGFLQFEITLKNINNNYIND